MDCTAGRSGVKDSADSPTKTLPAVEVGRGKPTTLYALAALEPAIKKGGTYQVSLRVVTNSGMKSDFGLSVMFTY